MTNTETIDANALLEIKTIKNEDSTKDIENDNDDETRAYTDINLTDEQYERLAHAAF